MFAAAVFVVYDAMIVQHAARVICFNHGMTEGARVAIVTCALCDVCDGIN